MNIIIIIIIIIIIKALLQLYTVSETPFLKFPEGDRDIFDCRPFDGCFGVWRAEACTVSYK